VVGLYRPINICQSNIFSRRVTVLNENREDNFCWEFISCYWTTNNDLIMVNTTSISDISLSNSCFNRWYQISRLSTTGRRMMARTSTDKITTECPWQTVISKLKHKHSCLEETYFSYFQQA